MPKGGKILTDPQLFDPREQDGYKAEVPEIEPMKCLGFFEIYLILNDNTLYLFITCLAIARSQPIETYMSWIR